jgi:hypothetical protein
MADTDVIKEFLVSLGFKVDDSSYRKFENAVKGSSNLAADLGKVATAAVISTTAAVAKVSEVMDKLYFVSQRTGSSVSSIQAFDYAISQTGGSADGAKQSLENLSHFIRAYPGGADFLKRLGVSSENTNDAAKSMKDLQKVFQDMPLHQGMTYANMLGIDEKTFLSMRSGELNKYLDDYNKRLAEVGVNGQSAAEKGNAFMTALRGIGAGAEVLGTVLVDKLAPALTDIIKLSDRSIGVFARAISHPETIIEGAKKLVTNPQEWAKNYDEALGLNEVFGAKKTSPSLGLSGLSREEKTKKIKEYFQSQGWSESQASGIAAGLYLESGFNPSINTGDGGKAYGIGQWHPDRQARFKAFAGKDIRGSSLEEQLAFTQYELTHQEKAAGDALRETATPYQAGMVFRNKFERPDQRLYDRGAETGKLATSISQTITFNIQGSDPRATAGEVSQRLNNATQNALRYSASVQK